MVCLMSSYRPNLQERNDDIETSIASQSSEIWDFETKYYLKKLLSICLVYLMLFKGLEIDGLSIVERYRES